jgi:molybdopterin/thiamine biosynthesis adenylyltransferase
MYERNYLYIPEEAQKNIANTKILLGGAGLGSVIAETALRLGFLNIAFYDFDKVEESNLNRQNYTINDIGAYKVDKLFERLKAINPASNLEYKNCRLGRDNLEEIIEGCDIAVNTIDFDTDAPYVFDEICVRKGVTVIHPYSYGWMACALVINESTPQIASFNNQKERIEISIARHVLRYIYRHGGDISWFKELLTEYKDYQHKSPPQLAVGSNLTAALVCEVMFRIANKMEVKYFPELHFVTTRQKERGYRKLKKILFGKP